MKIFSPEERAVYLATRNRKLLIVVDYRHTQEAREEMIHFVFFGGILTQSEVIKIVLQIEEIKAYKFCNLDEINKFTGESIGQRIERAMKAINSDGCIYQDSK